MADKAAENAEVTAPAAGDAPAPAPAPETKAEGAVVEDSAKGSDRKFSLHVAGRPTMACDGEYFPATKTSIG